jgi:oligoendopeptidase F
MQDLAERLDAINERYLELHRTRETAFWETRMGLADRGADLTEADLALKEFLGDATRLEELRSWKERGRFGAAQGVVLDGWILTLSRNQVNDPQARKLLRQLAEREEDLQRARGSMKLGYVEGGVVTEAASSIALGNSVRTDADPSRRRAGFEGLRSIETFVLGQGFADVLKIRNRFARALGFEDFYEYKAQWSEGIGKRTVFAFLDDLERRTREPARRSLDALSRRAGADALEPWNLAFHAGGGSLQKERDAYFPFAEALERWVRSFWALGIRFRDARVTLDLVDRPKKYENGFMHGPVPAFVRRGRWLPAEINFTANALPGRVGAGYRALQTLFHEGGHAAHFANIVMDAPCFSQEYAPTSVAMAETQSMFCDRLLGDADWQTRYARDARGEPLPFELMERELRGTQPFAAQAVRNMLVVCYAEKALYELPEAEMTPERVLSVVREVEARITQTPGGNPRPTLAVPHVLSRDSSAYYHGYVLAEMAVHQTRDHFLAKHGHLVDNPAVGADLARVYWAPGNGRPFLELVRELTGGDFSADALVRSVSRTDEDAIHEARGRIDGLARVPEPRGEPELDLRLRVIHGTETVVEEGASPLQVADAFRRWIVESFPRRSAD